MPERTPEGWFAVRTRVLRRAAGHTQPQLVELIASAGGPRMDPSNLARLERGERRITLDEAVVIANVVESCVVCRAGRELVVGAGCGRAEREAAETALVEAQHRLARARGSSRRTPYGRPLSDGDAAEAARQEAEGETSRAADGGS